MTGRPADSEGGLVLREVPTPPPEARRTGLERPCGLGWSSNALPFRALAYFSSVSR